MIDVFDLNQSKEWDRIVHSFMNYDVYWLSGYVKAFMLHGDGEPLLFFYEDETVRGINVVMKRDIVSDPYFKDMIEKDKFFDFSTPYGYGGWLIEGDYADKLFDSYGKWCRENNVISEFVRFHPVVANHLYSESGYEVIGLGETIVMDLSSPDVIWNNLTSKNRNVIRKAKKNGVRVYNGRYPEIYDKFMEIYNSTMDKDGAGSYYYFKPDFYKSVLEDLPQNAQIFYAQLEDGTIIASSIMLVANGYMNYHLSGFVQEYGSLAATNLLLYEAALWGCENGCRTLYLGGGVGSEKDNLFKFKKAFYRGEGRRFYIGKKIYDESEYDKLSSSKKYEGNYFPKYRGKL